jgi:hypothetical protein
VLAFRDLAAAFGIAELDLGAAAAVQHGVANLVRQFAPRSLDIELVMLRERLQHLEVVRVAPIPPAHGAARQREFVMRDHSRRIEELLMTQSIARAAGAGRTIERKHLRFERRHAESAHGAGVLIGKELFLNCGATLAFGFVSGQSRGAAGKAQCSFERFCEALRGIGSHAKAIDDHFDRVLALRVYFGQRVELVHATIEAHPHKAAAAQIVEHFGVLAFAVGDQRR